MDHEDPCRIVSVPVFLNDEDQMCLRRLLELEYDTCCPVCRELEGTDEATTTRVNGAMFSLGDTISAVLRTEGSLSLRHSDGHEESIDLFAMLKEAVADDSEPNTVFSLMHTNGICFLDHFLTGVIGAICNQPVSRGAAIRCAIRWRHYSLGLYLRHAKDPKDPELGIRFGEKWKGESQFLALGT